jgi:beta-RFAP synthase
MRINASVTSNTTPDLASTSFDGDVRLLRVTAASRPPHRVERVAGGVRVEAPGRLHLGFLDPSATLGRRFGSVGLAIDGMATIVEASFDRAEAVVAGDDAARGEIDRVREHVATLRALWQIEAPLRIVLQRTLPPHAGFGSGTQLALALAHAIAALHSRPVTATEAAEALARGARSGAGIAAFMQGGFLVDAGHGGAAATPPIIARMDFPDAWRIVLVMDESLGGLHGGAEARAIAALPPFPAERAAQLCHRLVMQVLPGVVERDFDRFAGALTTIQDANGSYFAPAQGGGMYVSRAVGRVLEFVRERFPSAVGQSSWGPTGFAFVPSQTIAEQVIGAVRAAGHVETCIRLVTVQGRNRGARIERLRGPGGAATDTSTAGDRT